MCEYVGFVIKLQDFFFDVSLKKFTLLFSEWMVVKSGPPYCLLKYLYDLLVILCKTVWQGCKKSETVRGEGCWCIIKPSFREKLPKHKNNLKLILKWKKFKPTKILFEHHWWDTRVFWKKKKKP